MRDHSGIGHISSPTPIGREGGRDHWKQGMRSITCISPVEKPTLRERWEFAADGTILDYTTELPDDSDRHSFGRRVPAEMYVVVLLVGVVVGLLLINNPF